MGQKPGGLWDRVQGKQQLQTICEKVFDQCERSGLPARSNLPLATFMVYNSVNKHFLNRRFEPPSLEEIKKKEKVFFERNGTDRGKFCSLIKDWIQKDLRFFLITKIALALLAAPAMALVTKNVGMQVPRIQHAVEKIPTPVFISAYTVGFVLLQDVRVD